MPNRLALAAAGLGVLGIAGIVAIDFGRSAAGGSEICLVADLDVAGARKGTCLSQAGARGLMKEPLSAPALELTHPTDTAQRKRPATCNEYVALARDGWYAMTGRDMSVEGQYKETCGVLAALTRASAARRDLVDGSGGLAELSLLGEEILPALGEAGGHFTPSAGKPPRSLSALSASSDCAIESASSDELRLTCNGLDVVYRKLALADFNGDGFEDMLVGVGARASGGTQQMSDLIVLTRTTPSGRFELTSMP